MQLILIIHGLHIYKLARSLKFIYNPKCAVSSEFKANESTLY